MITELLHREVSLLLTQIAVKGFCIVAIPNQFVGNLLRLYLRSAEDNGENARVEVDQAFQSQVFVLRIHHIIDVVHLLCALVAAADDNLFVVVQIALGNLFDFSTHGGREQERVPFGGNTFENGVDTFGKAHVEHLVCLVEHHVIHGIELCYAALHQVDEASRSSNDDLCTLSELADLHLDGSSSVNGHDV